MKILDVLSSPWAIAPEKLAEIKTIYRAHFAGEKIDWRSLEAKAGISGALGKRGKDDPPYEMVGGAAVINIEGVLTKGMSFFSFLFGGTSTREISRALAAALNDDAAQAIVLRVDSPGGTVDGTQELAEQVFAARGKKPIIAYSDGQVTSAAYWIASAADQLYLSGDTVAAGSIGVVATHVDYSKADEMQGVKVTEITAGKYKRIYSENAPLSPEGRQTLQDEVDYLYSVFVNDTARNRGRFVEDALAMADGKIFFGKQAVEAGLADGIATMEGLIDKISGGAPDEQFKIKAKEETSVDSKTLKEKYPDLYQSVLNEGSALAQAEAEARQTAADAAHAQAIKDAQGETEAKVAEALTTERDRVKKIQALAIPGHEKLIEEAIASGASVEATAVKIIAAEKAVKDEALALLKKDAATFKKVPATDAAGADEERGKEEEQRKQAKDVPLDAASMSPEDFEAEAKKIWDASEGVRAEYKIGGFKAFLAFKKNEKNIRIKGA